MEVLYDVLLSAGLDEGESLIYTTLLDNGALSVLEISKKSKLKRTNLYNQLISLENKGLVSRITRGNTTKFSPKSPREVLNLLEAKENQIEIAKNTFEILINSLQSKYNTISQKPVISYLEGLRGLKMLYQDINDTGKDIFLLRSTYDDKRSDVDRIIGKQIAEQAKRGIHAKVVGPPEKDAKELYIKYDRVRLVEEHFVHKFPFNLPAQIIIYGDKTAISTIRKDIIITLIDNPEITHTFRVLFDFIWEYSGQQHNEMVKKWM